MGTILKNELIVYFVLLKTIGIPSHSPQIENQKANSSKNGEDIVHGVDSMLVIKINNVEGKQHQDSHDSDDGNPTIETNKTVRSFGSFFFIQESIIF